MSSVVHATQAHRRRHWSRAALTVGATAVTAALVGLMGTPAWAAVPVGLGTAESFAVLAGSTVTNTGPSVIRGNVGVSPGSAVVGFPPGLVADGVIHAADAVAAQAQSDLVTAYNNAAGQPSTPVATELGGQTFTTGVYSNATALGLTGTVTLDAQGDPAAVFIFQAGSTLITASNSTVSLINGASPCNVFWQVGSSATLGTNTTFVGTVMALTSISAQTGTTVNGRLLARNGAVTLDNNVITRPNCTTPPPATDLSVAVTDNAPDTGVPTDQLVTYTSTVTNNGPTATTDTQVQMAVPPGRSATGTIPAGAVATPGGYLVPVGPLDAGESAVLTFQFAWDQPGAYTVQATVSGTGVTETNLANNTASVTTTVQAGNVTPTPSNGASPTRVVIPSGHPETGEGPGSSNSGVLLAAGTALLLGAVAGTALLIRHRRELSDVDGSGRTTLGS